MLRTRRRRENPQSCRFMNLSSLQYCFHCFLIFLLVALCTVRASPMIYTIGDNVRDEQELYDFADIHHYKVSPLYAWPSKHFVVDDTAMLNNAVKNGHNDMQHVQNRARLLSHKVHEPKVYIRKQEADYGYRTGLPYTTVDNNFYFPSNVSLHNVHYNLNTLPSTINGTGVEVYIPDGGSQCDHAAFLRGDNPASCNPLKGFSVCNDDKGTLPFDDTDFHGTMCASVICAGKSSYGGGIAYGATCIPRRYICATREWTIIDEARGNAVDHSAVLSVSNGPPDFMMYYEFPPQPLLDGIEESWRRGLIRVDAIGNGYSVGDHATFDWTTCLRQTLAITAMSAAGIKEEYSEVGPNAFMSGFGAGGSNYIYTAFPSSTKKELSNIFDGTSAAAPQYAGIIARILSANSGLDQRNMVALLIRSATREGIFDYEFPFEPNDAGYIHSDGYGFGYVNVSKAVELATDPTRVDIPAERECRATMLSSKINSDDAFTRIEMDMSHCDLQFVEFVNLRLTCLLPSSSSLTGISLISPAGTQGIFLNAGHLYRIQNLDLFSGGWKWYGESATGTWVFEISTLDDFEVSVASLFIYGY